MYFECEGFIDMSTKVFDTLAWRDSSAIDDKGVVGGEVSYLLSTAMWEAVKEVGFGGGKG
jgi:hypothetical protein